MKWIKYDPENPPVNKVIFRLETYNGHVVIKIGELIKNYELIEKYYGKNVFYVDSVIANQYDLLKANAHYIELDKLEMPE